MKSWEKQTKTIEDAAVRQTTGVVAAEDKIVSSSLVWIQDVLNFDKIHKLLEAMFTSKSAVLCTVE